jgi:hypothetical protein
MKRIKWMDFRSRGCSDYSEPVPKRLSQPLRNNFVFITFIRFRFAYQVSQTEESGL